MYIVADEIKSRVRHERQVAHARHAVASQRGEESAVSVGHLRVAERSHDARHERHGRRLAHDTRELTVLEAIVGASGGRDAVACQAKLAQGGGIQPQCVRVARIQRCGTIGERLVERVLRRHDGRVPAVLPPSLGQKPAVGPSGCGGAHARDAVGLALANERGGERGGVDGGMEEVQMGIMESRQNERVAEVAHLGRARFAVRLSYEGAHILVGPHGSDTVACDSDRGGSCRDGRSREHAGALDDEIDVHERALLSPPPSWRDCRNYARTKYPALHCRALRVGLLYGDGIGPFRERISPGTTAARTGIRRRRWSV